MNHDPRRARLLARARRELRRLVLPLVCALPPLAWVVEGTRRASLTTLGRDQGIFQYIAWALLRGQTDYRDVRDVNGPLTHLVHLVFLLLGGADEHRFRVLDMLVSGASFAFVGACLPGVARTPGYRVRASERFAWALTAWVVLSAQYLHYIFWDLAQRESFFDWFMLTSTALQLYAASRRETDTARTKTWALFAVVGALSVIPWFGKPTYVVFTAAQLLTLLLDGEGSRKRRLAAFGIGGALGAATQLAFLFAYADVGAFLRVYFVDVPGIYRFIWPRTALDTLTLPGLSTLAALSFITSAVMVGLIVEKQLPRRLFAVSVLPLGGLVSVLAQRKGFPYHFHPVSAGLYVQWLVLLVWLGERLGRRGSRVREGASGMGRLVPIAAAAGLTVYVTTELMGSQHLQDLWILGKGATPELRETYDYLVYFKTNDFFPWEMRQTARYLREHTQPGDRVQMYGMDPYLLFLAERLSATPYIYAYDLNLDAALWGSSFPEGLHPTDAEARHIRAVRDAHEEDLMARVKSDPPAAFVFMDKAPLMTAPDAWLDFAAHNLATAAWVGERYEETAAFGDDHVWLRRDLATGVAGEQPAPADRAGPQHQEGVPHHDGEAEPEGR